jgi:plastocyanin
VALQLRGKEAMFNTAAKLEFGIAGLAFAAALIGAVAADDPAGVTILVGVALAAFLAGLVLTTYQSQDWAPDYARDAPPVRMAAVDTRTEAPSLWPLVTAVAVGLFAIGAAVGHVLVIIGVVCGLIAAGGWVAQDWREDPTFTPRIGARVSDRLVTPIGLPVVAVLLILTIILSVSRILLAVPKAASVAIAGTLAIVLLLSFFAIASRPRLNRTVFFFLGALALTTLVAAGGVSAGAGYRKFDKHPAEIAGVRVPIVKVSAKGIQFDTKVIAVQAGVPAFIQFTNHDVGTYHNIAVYTQTSGGDPIWDGAPIEGGKPTEAIYQIAHGTVLYAHTFTQPGTYSFRCDFHPSMVGTFLVR